MNHSQGVYAYGKGGVEDSHAKVAAKQRALIEWLYTRAPGDNGMLRTIDELEDVAARVEALGRVEEKKAAASAVWMCESCGETFDKDMPSGHPRYPNGEQCGPVSLYRAGQPQANVEEKKAGGGA